VPQNNEYIFKSVFFKFIFSLLGGRIVDLHDDGSYQRIADFWFWNRTRVVLAPSHQTGPASIFQNKAGGIQIRSLQYGRRVSVAPSGSRPERA
jgi:hypothetical protein